MSGKQAKKERKAQREAQREAARKAERQRQIFTVIVIGIVLVIGGVLVWISLEGDDVDLAEEDATEESDEGDNPEDAEGEDPEEAVSADRPVACGGEVPPTAGEDKPTFDAPESVLAEGRDYRAIVETSCGTVVIDLDEQGAPATVNSFVFLAEQGFHDGLEIFRHASGLNALQTGAGTNEASWDVGYTLDDELGPAERDGYPPGTVAMANRGPNTNGSQFFFVYGDGFQESIASGALGPTYPRFGTVVEGLDVLRRIAEVPVEGETPQEVIYLESVTIVAE